MVRESERSRPNRHRENQMGGLSDLYTQPIDADNDLKEGEATSDLSRELGFCPTKVRSDRLEFSPLSLPANSAMPPL